MKPVLLLSQWARLLSKALSDTSQAPTPAPEAATPPPITEFLEVERKICHSKGGKWKDDESDCDPFMKSSNSKISFGSSICA